MSDYELIQVQREVLNAAIPVESRWQLISMYEDRDLEGHEAAEELVAFLERATPGLYVGLLVNSCHNPGCDLTQKEHYGCEVYDPIWDIVLVPKAIWEQSLAKREEALEKFKEDNRCRHAKTS